MKIAGFWKSSPHIYLTYIYIHINLPDPGWLPMPAGKSIRVHDPVTAYTVVEREYER